MKRYKQTLPMEVETISAKMVFDLIEKFGEGDHSGFSCYDVTDRTTDWLAKRWRCDMGDLGSFEVSHYTGDEEYETKRNDWVWVEGEVYRYSSNSTTYNGLPYLTIETAYDKLNSPK